MGRLKLQPGIKAIEEEPEEYENSISDRDKTALGRLKLQAEAGMNAQAINKFVEENQKLAEECAELLARCEKFENQCSLYDRDLQALMDFGNEADARAVVAESRVHYLEQELSKLTEEVQSFKQQQNTDYNRNACFS